MLDQNRKFNNQLFEIDLEYGRRKKIMAYLVKQGTRVDYNYKEFYLDSADELNELDVKSCCPGSVAYIITSGDVYILTNEKKWRLQ